MASEMMAKHSVLIVGAGKIGAFFDVPQSESVLTHAHAFTQNIDFVLEGFLDPDQDQALRAANLWGAKTFNSLASAFSQGAIDVVVVATPDETHYSLLRDLAEYPVKLVFAEKPLARSRAEAESLVHLYREKGIGLGVNYSRRFVPAFSMMRETIATGKLGSYLSGTGYYGKGTLHNGSHMIDLLRLLLGEPTEIMTLHANRDWNDDDPTCSAYLKIAGGQFSLQGVDCRHFTIFEMDLLFENGRVRIVNSGAEIEIYEVVDSQIFAGYRVLSDVQTIKVDLGAALPAAVENIRGYLTAGASILSTGEDALRTISICTDIAGGLR
ncbi:MAG: Gfo/Idh/MocA family oxidoreductase [Bryocella sp.]